MSNPAQIPQPNVADIGAPPPYSSAVDLAHNRPSLPEIHRNPFLQSLPEDAHLVKFQTIVRENRNIIVGRVKVPIPGQARHAFILRRYDTDAISMTTMFKVAFPGANEAAEKREEEWVVSNFDTRGTNGGRNNDHVRLAGTWVSRQLAVHLAPAYGVGTLVGALARAKPDPRVEYRMSQRSVQAQEAFARSRAAGAAAPAPADGQTAAAAPAQGGPTPKRQRAAAPAQASDADTTTATAGAAPAEASTSTAASGGEQRTYTLEAVTTITAPVGTEAHMDAEIAASKQLVLDLKKEMRLRSAAGRSLADDGAEDDSASAAESSAAGASRAAKRSADDDEPTVIPAGSARPSEARVIRRNRRIEVQGPGATRQQTVKKVAWSAVVFGLGFAASTLLPSFASLNF